MYESREGDPMQDTQLVIPSSVRPRLLSALKHNNDPMSQEIRTFIRRWSDGPVFIDGIEGAQITEAMICSTTEDDAAVLKDTYLEEIRPNYPQINSGQNIDPPRAYTRHFMKAHPEASGKRPELTGAYDACVQESWQQLTKGVLDDDLHRSAVPIPDEADLTNQYIEVGRGLLEEIDARISRLEGNAFLKGILWLAATALSKVVNSGHGNTLSVDDNKDSRANIERLRDLLRVVDEGAAGIARVTAQAYCRNNPLPREILLPRYDELSCAAVALLPAQLQAAFTRTLYIGVVSEQPAAVATEPLLAAGDTPHKKSPSPRADEYNENLGQKPPFYEERWGEFKNPFKHLGRDTLEINKVSDPNGNTIFFSTAIPPSLQEIGDKLMGNPATAGMLTRFTERIKEIILSNNALSHNSIRHCSGINVDGLTMHYFKNSAANGKRIYFVQTTVGQVPTLHESARAQRIPLETRLVLHVATTDKQHQLEVYSYFGMPRPQAKAQGVGAK